MTYTDDNRGRFQHTKRAKQLIEFPGLRYGNCTPTDIDGFIEWRNEVFVVFEIKHGDEKLPLGQKRALMNLVNNLTDAGKKAVLFVARHNVSDPKETVIAADTEVVLVYLKEGDDGVWYKAKGETLKELTDRFMKKWATF